MGMVAPGPGPGHAAAAGHVRAFETASAEAVDDASQLEDDAQGGAADKRQKLRTVVLQTPSDSVRSRTREERKEGAWMPVRAWRQGQGQEQGQVQGQEQRREREREREREPAQGQGGLWWKDRQRNDDLAVGWLPGAPSSEEDGASDYVATARVAAAPGAVSGSGSAKEHGGGTSFVAAAVRQVGPSVVLIDTEHTPPR